VLAFNLAYAAEVEHGTERRFALAKRGFCRLPPGSGPRRGLHGSETRAPTRQQRQPGPPASERRGRNHHRREGSSLARVLSFQAVGLTNKQRHVGTRTVKKRSRQALAYDGRTYPVTIVPT